jgi:MYND finger
MFFLVLFLNFVFYLVGFYLNKHVFYKVNNVTFRLHCFWHENKKMLVPDQLAFQFGYMVGCICVVSRSRRCWNCKKDVKCMKCCMCSMAMYCSKECQSSDWKRHKIMCVNVQNSIKSNKQPSEETYKSEPRIV